MKKLLCTILLLFSFLIVMGNEASAKAKTEWTKCKATKYAKTNIIIYDSPKTSSSPLDTYVKSDKIKVVALSKDEKWYTVKIHKRKGYIQNDSSVSDTKIRKTYKGKKLNSRRGVVDGPSGRETYYNMYMGNVVKSMRQKGYNSSKYPYWTRMDGCKMLGPYIIVAANFKIREKGTVLETSLGKGIVCDTGGFVRSCPRGLDIATSWR